MGFKKFGLRKRLAVILLKKSLDMLYVCKKKKIKTSFVSGFKNTACEITDLESLSCSHLCLHQLEWDVCKIQGSVTFLP